MAVLIIVSVVIGAALFLGGLLTMQGADGPDRSAGFKTGLSMKDQESWSFANRFFGRGLAVIGAVGALLSAVMPVILLLKVSGKAAAVSAGALILGECAAMAVLCAVTQSRLRKREPGGAGNGKENQ